MMFLSEETNGKEIEPEQVKEMLASVSKFADQDGELPHLMLDDINCKMYDDIRPLEWVDPVLPNINGNKEDFYDMVCIGGGAAGMVTAAGTAYMGGKALMIERNFVGGDCLVTGCVPSKAFLKAANVAHKIRTGE